MDWIAVIILLAVTQLMVFGMITGFSRGKFDVKAPATTGNEDWERRFRVQQNTMEHLVAFIPAIWLCATYTSVALAIGLGCIYLVGRIIYAIGYIKAPPKRAPGMMASFFPTALLVLAALGGALMTALA